MRLKGKATAVLLSVVLTCTMFGSPAHAASPEEFSSDADSSSSKTTVESGDADEAVSQESDLTDSASSPTYSESKAVGEDAECQNGLPEATGQLGDVVQVAVENAIGFVYIDESVVSVGQEQNIAIVLSDEAAAINGAQLRLEGVGDGRSMTVDASQLAGDAMLFTVAFNDESDAAAYRLSWVRYEVGGVAYQVDLSEANNDESQYAFDVVTRSVGKALKGSSGEGGIGGISAFTVQDDGSLVAAESVEEAIANADEEGAQDLSEGDSVVDQEMLENGVTGEEGAESDEREGADALVGSLLGAQEAWAAATNAREDYLIVAIDPGHGGYDGGAAAYGLTEKNLTLSIARACYDKLSTYTGVTPYLTRSGDEYVGLQQRVDRAVAMCADVFVSIHINAGGGTGAEVWAPNDSSYNYYTHTEGSDLGNKILSKLASLGLANRGVKFRDSERVNGSGPYYYPDGSIQDYYTIIEASREAGMPGIIVEHAFIDNASDASKLSNGAFLKQLGEADASGIVQKYGLVTRDAAKAQSLVEAKGHTSDIGWLTEVYDRKVIGTTGKNKGLEAFSAKLTNAAASVGGIQYRSYVGSAWQGWQSNGSTSGTTGKGTSIQAVQMKLTGTAAQKYDVYYRVHVANIGWLGWAKNGASAGSTGFNYNAEAVEIAIVSKGVAAPGSTATPYKVPTTSVSYQAHVANVGWQNAVSAGSTAGTTGRNLSIEALKIQLATPQYSGSIQYNVHCSDIGWQGWKSSGAVGGTTGQVRQTEAIQIKLTGEVANQYDVYYRVHSAEFGWLGWAKNGETAGTEGYGYSMQAIQVKLVKSGGAAPGSTANHSYKALVKYRSHVANVGWQGHAYNGATSGTTGRGLAVEALQIELRNQTSPGSVQYRTHCADIGWQGWRTGPTVAGTTGQARQTEAVQIKLTGAMANGYDVYYRVHSAEFGWLGWAKNGASAGTAGYGYSLQAIQVVLVQKGGSAPGSTANAFHEKKISSSRIMGASQATAVQMVAYYKSVGKTYPSSAYSLKGAASIETFCQLVCEEANAEGVRAEVLFCQAMKETGWLQFGGSVKASQCNFGGIGATSSTAGGATFEDVRTGLRAQVQHLKAYASTEPLRNTCVDPRFDYVTRGVAPNLEDLNGRWAVPGTNYGQDILGMINTLLKY